MRLASALLVIGGLLGTGVARAQAAWFSELSPQSRTVNGPSGTTILPAYLEVSGVGGQGTLELVIIDTRANAGLRYGLVRQVLPIGAATIGVFGGISGGGGTSGWGPEVRLLSLGTWPEGYLTLPGVPLPDGLLTVATPASVPAPFDGLGSTSILARTFLLYAGTSGFVFGNKVTTKTTSAPLLATLTIAGPSSPATTYAGTPILTLANATDVIAGYGGDANSATYVTGTADVNNTLTLGNWVYQLNPGLSNILPQLAHHPEPVTLTLLMLSSPLLFRVRRR